MNDDAIAEFLGRAIYPEGAYPQQPTWELWTLDYELIHKLVLKMLCDSTPGFLADLCPSGSSSGRTCLIEPAGGLYDVRILTDHAVAEIEIKVWSPLTSDQVARQIEPIRTSGTRLFYLLLGRTGVQRSRQWVSETTIGLGAKISYRELDASLAALIAANAAGPFARQLATAYHKALTAQYERIRKSFGKDPNW